jgi:hypothetical protein
MSTAQARAHQDQTEINPDLAPSLDRTALTAAALAYLPGGVHNE